jgi:hypothetical protein
VGDGATLGVGEGENGSPMRFGRLGMGMGLGLGGINGVRLISQVRPAVHPDISPPRHTRSGIPSPHKVEASENFPRKSSPPPQPLSRPGLRERVGWGQRIRRVGVPVRAAAGAGRCNRRGRYRSR